MTSNHPRKTKAATTRKTKQTAAQTIRNQKLQSDSNNQSKRAEQDQAPKNVFDNLKKLT